MKMYINILNSVHIPFVCLLFILITTYMFFKKSKIRTEENTVYSILSISVIISIVIDIISIYLMQRYPNNYLLNVLFAKSYLCFQLFYIVCLTYYLFVITKKSNKDYCTLSLIYNKKVLFIGSFLIVVQSLLIMLLKINFYHTGNAYFFRGSCLAFVYFMNVFYALIWIFRLVKYYNEIDRNKLMAYVIYMALELLTIVLELKFPELTIHTFAISFALFLLYFLLDNPDIELINELEFTKKQIESAASAKDDFLSNMSHEIRTPLNAILGFSQLLSEKDTTDIEKESINEIEYASNVLMDIVNGILDISKMEAGKFELYETDYSINNLVNDLKQKMLIRSRNKDIEIEYKIGLNIPKALYGDPLQVSQIMSQLLSNSIKFTEHGKIVFSVDGVVTDDECILTISSEDTGIGIKEEDLNKIFNKFEKLETTRALKVEGAGLGLAITKRLVKMMNGTVMVQSVYGKGSKFTVMINQKVSSAIIKEDKGVPINSDFSGKKVLIVDDNPLNIKVAERLLKSYKCLTECVFSGEECLKKIESNEKYDLIFMDDMMPELSGLQTLEKLKKIEGFNTKVIVLTANSSNGVKTKYLDDGFDDYLAKPINKDELGKVLNNNLTNGNEG